MRIFLVAALLVAFLAIIFALQNSAPIFVTFGVWRVTASLALVLLITLGLGLVTGLLVSMPAIIGRNLKLAKYKRQVTQLEANLDNVNQDLAHHQHLLAQAQAELSSQRTQLEEGPLSDDQSPRLLPESEPLETAELIDDDEEWV
ncbi:MAG: LapA family protein [Merismopedia sp. SIO2A8]|nr:LapA family protein [Symploca sp. SIO2B6]NET51866.1 LapA family protein [Merismopedia sp. SIO2A8]